MHRVDGHAHHRHLSETDMKAATQGPPEREGVVPAVAASRERYDLGGVDPDAYEL